MKRIVRIGTLIATIVMVFNLSGCAVEPVYPHAYREPRYVIPSDGWAWRQHHREGWGWFQENRGWHRGWR